MGCSLRKGYHPLKCRRNECHHLMSAWNSGESLCLVALWGSKFIRSGLHLRNVRPPYTPRQAQFNLPARLCSCFLLVTAFLSKHRANRCRSSNLSLGRAISHSRVSSSTQRNTSFSVGVITLPQLIWNPRS